MILVLKKIACIVVLLCCILNLAILAEEDFYVYGKDNKQISEMFFDMSEEELEKYCKENMITYLAVNPDNTKQVRKSEFQDEFSKKVRELSVLSDKEILDLAEELSGFSDVKGKIVNRNTMKFLKIELKTEDRGGEYVLTQYITVHDGKKILLTFYTDADVERDYIQSVFENQFPKQTDYKPFIIIGFVVFGFAAVLVTLLIVKELRKKEE